MLDTEIPKLVLEKLFVNHKEYKVLKIEEAKLLIKLKPW